MVSGKKSALRTVEALFAAAILIFFIVVMNNIYLRKARGKDPSLISTVEDSLLLLDENQSLRGLVVSLNFTEIEKRIEDLGNNTIDVKVTICNLTMCVGESLETENVVTYVISGNGSYNPFEVKVYAKKI